jgi:hypothetical protein
MLPHSAIDNPELIQALIRASIEEPGETEQANSSPMRDQQDHEELREHDGGLELQPEVQAFLNEKFTNPKKRKRSPSATSAVSQLTARGMTLRSRFKKRKLNESDDDQEDATEI